jgi:hypothetical protein
MFFIAFGVIIIGGTLFLTFITSSHRWTFYSSKWTGPEYFKWWFDASQLIYDANTKDQQRTYCWLLAHPSHLAQDKVKEWLLGLKSDGEILGGGDKKIPKGCGGFSGHSLDSFLTKSLQRYAYYKDTESLTLVKAHLDKLKEEVSSRPLVDTIKSVSRRSMKNAEEEEEERLADTMNKAHAEETLQLKAALLEKDEKITTLQTALAANEKLVADLKAKLAEN